MVRFSASYIYKDKILLDDFAISFFDADTVIVSDIYAAREIDNGEINSKTLVEKINKAGESHIWIILTPSQNI